MATVTKDLGDVVVSITTMKMSGVDVVHERMVKRGAVRGLYYVEAMQLLRFRPKTQVVLRKGCRDERALRDLIKEHAYELQ